MLSRVRVAIELRRGGWLLLVGVVFAGCRGGDRLADVKELPVLDGISVLEFDGLNLRVKRAADATDRILVVNGRGVREVNLRVGDGFVLTNGRDQHEAYHVLAVSDERVMLKRQTMLDHSATREGVRTVEDVIAVTPYNLEEAEQRRLLGTAP